METIFRVDRLPVFQNKMYDSPVAAIKCPKGDVVLVQDTNTGLIFNSDFDEALMHYDSSYQNEQASSAIFNKHLQEVGNIILHYWKGMRLVEIGCGKGYFLEHLTSEGFDIIGYDPSYEGDNPAIKKMYYGPEISIKADGIILRHVLEHIVNPVEFLFQIRSLKPDAMIYIEVPCFDWICHNRAWFDIFYEHVNYFRKDDFVRMFGKIYESGHLFNGQYLYVLADLSTLKAPVFRGELAIIPDDFLKGLYSASNMVKEDPEGTYVVWGGASKGVMFSLFMKRMGAEIKHIIDINPAKQGKYLGGTGLKVSSPDKVLKSLPDGSTIFIMNSNYAKEIYDVAGERFQYWRIDNDF